jgi:hypothetical protein
MANKKQNQTKKEIETQEQNRIQQIESDYKEYVGRIEARIEVGEKLEIKPFDKWIRKATKTLGDQTFEISVSGDSGETKNQRFKRLGKARMIKALDALDMLINLSSAQYDASPEEVTMMINALNLKVLDIKNSFESQVKPIDEFEF